MHGVINCLGTGREMCGASEDSWTVTAEELAFGQNKAMKAEIGEDFISCDLVMGRGYLVEHVYLVGTWENMCI